MQSIKTKYCWRHLANSGRTQTINQIHNQPLALLLHASKSSIVTITLIIHLLTTKYILHKIQKNGPNYMSFFCMTSDRHTFKDPTNVRLHWMTCLSYWISDTSNPPIFFKFTETTVKYVLRIQEKQFFQNLNFFLCFLTIFANGTFRTIFDMKNH